MRALDTAALIVVVLVGGYFGFNAMYPSATIRYRLTLAVNTPEGIKTGSGVIEVTYAKAVRLLGSSAEITTGVKGEAVVVDLGKRGILFALLKEGAKPEVGARMDRDEGVRLSGRRHRLAAGHRHCAASYAARQSRIAIRRAAAAGALPRHP